MFPLFIFVMLVYLNVYTETYEIEVVSSGIMNLNKNDMVVLLYVTVQNHGIRARRAMVNVAECCEKITSEDTDCDLMNIYGGDFGLINAGETRNFTLIYPNIYGYNRKGFCFVDILHRGLGSSQSSEIHHRVDFDTTVKADNVPAALQGWYDPDTIVDCETPDLDPFDHCNPVNCHLKYSGYRNYYDRKWKMCQRVPVCLTNPKKELPDVAYMPNTNKCKNLENIITKEDITMISEGKLGMKTAEPKMVDIRCHHGEIDPKTGLCVCDYGWKSEPFDQESYNPTHTIYSMCTIKCYNHSQYDFLPPLLGLALGFWVCFCIICCEMQNLCAVRKVPRTSCYPTPSAYHPLQGQNEAYPNFGQPQVFDVSQCIMPSYQQTENSFQTKSQMSLSSFKYT